MRTRHAAHNLDGMNWGLFIAGIDLTIIGVALIVWAWRLGD